MSDVFKAILIKKINAAVSAVDSKNYETFTEALVDLGEHLQAENEIQNALTPNNELTNLKQLLKEERKNYRDALKAHKKTNKKEEDKQESDSLESTIKNYNKQANNAEEAIKNRYNAIRRAVINLDLKNVENQKLNTINNQLAFAAYLLGWQDDYLKSADVQKGQLRAKAGLNKSTRHAIKLALLALDAVAINPNPGPISAGNTEQISKDYLEPILSSISSYQTSRQKILSGIGKFLAFFVAFSSGLMTGVAIISTLGTAWPILLGASIIFVAGSYVNWKAFSAVIPNFLLSIAGKDKPFAGIIEFFSKNGDLKQLSTGRIPLLAAALFLSTAVGVTFAALTYSAVVGLSSVPALAFLSVGIASAILPPVGIVLAAITAVGMLALMSRAFIAMLQTENLKKSFLRPFSTVAKVFQKEAEANKGKSDLRLKIEKGITYGVLAVVSTAGLLGLGLFSYTCSLSVADFLTKMLSVGPAIATGVGFAIGMGLAFAGQVPFILEAAALMTAKMAGYFRDFVAATGNAVQNLFSSNKPENVKEPVVAQVSEQPKSAQSKEIIVTYTFSLKFQAFLENTKAGMTKVKNVFAGLLDFSSKMINAVGNGFLAIPSGVSAWLASITLGTATLNSLNFGFSGDVVGDAKAREAQRKALEHNVSSLQGKLVQNQNQNQKNVNVDPILSKHFCFNIFNKANNSVPNGVHQNGYQQENGHHHENETNHSHQI